MEENMEEKPKDTKHVKRIIIGSLVAAVLLCVGIFVGVKLSGGADSSAGTSVNGTGQVDAEAEDWQGAKKQPAAGSENTGIAIPGFKSLTFQAGKTEQAVNFYNPDVNDCYFVMTLLLPDGTELWKSELIEPGKGFYTITIDQALEAGSYPDSILKYQCYTQDEEQTELNGSEMKFELIVE